MTQPVSYVEINSPDRQRSARFMTDVFGWQFRPFADPGYLVADHGSADGVDTGLMHSPDGQARSIPVIRVPSLEQANADVAGAGGRLVCLSSPSRASAEGATSPIPPACCSACTNTTRRWMRAEPDGLAAGDLLPSTLFVHRCTMMYMTQLSVSEARAILPELLDRVERGEEITITRHGRPAAVLLRPDSVRMRRAKQTIERAREVAALLSAGARPAVARPGAEC